MRNILSLTFAASLMFSTQAFAKDDKSDQSKGQKNAANESDNPFKDNKDVEAYKKWAAEKEKKDKNHKAAKMKQAMTKAAEADKEMAGERYEVEIQIDVRSFSTNDHFSKSRSNESVLINRSLTMSGRNGVINLDGTNNDNEIASTPKSMWIKLYSNMKSESGQQLLDSCTDIAKKSGANSMVVRGKDVARHTVIVSQQELVRSFGWEWFLFKLEGRDRPSMNWRQMIKEIGDMVRVRSGITFNLDSGNFSCESK